MAFGAHVGETDCYICLLSSYLNYSFCLQSDIRELSPAPVFHVGPHGPFPPVWLWFPQLSSLTLGWRLKLEEATWFLSRVHIHSVPPVQLLLVCSSSASCVLSIADFIKSHGFWLLRASLGPQI